MKVMSGRYVGLVLLLWACGTKPNPHSCADGICNDQSFPFCDVDGTLGGEPDECIAVSCTPMEHIACRGDQAIRCNATGNNYDVVQCERGCDAATGCTSCTTNDQCSNPSPVCDLGTHSCRTCTLDDECGSRVCDVDSGTCLAESQVVYASPVGPASGDCSQNTPCSLAFAITTAFGNPQRSTIRALPGVYTHMLHVTGDGKISIVGTGATFQPTDGGLYLDQGDLTIRGMELRMDSELNDEGLSAPTKLELRDLAFTTSKRFVIFNGSAKLTRVTLRAMNPAAEIVVNPSATLEAEQSRFICVQGGCYLNMYSGTSKVITIFNSVFEDWLFAFSTADTSTASTFTFAFDTFYAPTSAVPIIDCTGNGAWSARFENSIINSGSGDTVVPGAKCTLSHDVIFPQTTPVAGSNLFMSPQFVDVNNRDLHLKMGSPAVDAAVPSTGLDTTKDFEGTPRPQGAAKDIGAFERKP